MRNKDFTEGCEALLRIKSDTSLYQDCDLFFSIFIDKLTETSIADRRGDRRSN
jgi:hypothetical protein